MCKHLLQVGFPIIMALVTHLLLRGYKMSNLFRGIMSARRRRAGEAPKPLIARKGTSPDLDFFEDCGILVRQNVLIRQEQHRAEMVVTDRGAWANHGLTAWWEETMDRGARANHGLTAWWEDTMDKKNTTPSNVYGLECLSTR
ncbi:hypothetical protein Peur_028552 [Populus x canadensis]